MLYIALNTLFNALLLGLVFAIGADFLHISAWVAIVAGYGVSAILTLIGYTKLGTFIVGLFMPGRKMIGRERLMLEPLLADIIERVNREYKTNYRLQDFKIRVTDDKVVNAFALGYNVITVNRGAFDAFSIGQLRAILAHEMGHLFYRDSVKRIALIFSAFATRIIMILYAIYAGIVAAFGAVSDSDRSGFSAIVTLVGFCFLVLFIPVVILNWLGSKIFNLLNMAMSRKAEYRADAFASSLGYQADMISALEVLDGITVYDNSFMAKIMATHPSAIQRIGALEDGEIAKSKIGSLFVAVPFATAHNDLGGNSEAVRLGFTLLLVGGLWCGYTMWDAYNKSPQHKLSVYNEFKPQPVNRAAKPVSGHKKHQHGKGHN